MIFTREQRPDFNFARLRIVIIQIVEFFVNVFITLAFTSSIALICLPDLGLSSIYSSRIILLFKGSYPRSFVCFYSL
jgi:hypothetical protein